MSEPKRIQRRRTKGWRMPEGAVYVGRPTKWGNPWRRHSDETDDQMLVRYLRHVLRLIESGALDISELRGKDLACWCPLDAPCHADFLLRLANER